MTNTKKTKKEMFAEIMTLLRTIDCENKEAMLAFLAHEIELLENKASKSGPTKTQKENEILILQLEKALAEFEKPITISEFMQKSSSEVATLTNQKLSALLKKCVEERKTVVKTVEKKKSYFALVRE